jgi:hypothetical protein
MSNDSKILKKIKEKNFKIFEKHRWATKTNGLSINEVERKLHKNIFFLAGEFLDSFQSTKQVSCENKIHSNT